MGPLDSLNHLINFAGPAFVLAVLMPGFARLMVNGKGAGPAFWVQAVVNFTVCLATLLAGLWFWGRDGKMATYFAMLLVCATAQWGMWRAWKA